MLRAATSRLGGFGGQILWRGKRLNGIQRNGVLFMATAARIRGSWTRLYAHAYCGDLARQRIPAAGRR